MIIGGLNWGLIGGFDYNLVNAVLGSVAWLERLIYILVGLSALLLLIGCKCKKCKAADTKEGGKPAKKMEGGSEGGSEGGM